MTYVNAIGVRYDDRIFEIGDAIPVSREWIDNVCTDTELDGTCAIWLGYGIDEEGLIDAPDDWLTVDRVKELAAAKKDLYPYEHAYLIAGHDEGWGDDDGEIIISDATVIARLW